MKYLLISFILIISCKDMEIESSSEKDMKIKYHTTLLAYLENHLKGKFTVVKFVDSYIHGEFSNDPEIEIIMSELKKIKMNTDKRSTYDYPEEKYRSAFYIEGCK